MDWQQFATNFGLPGLLIGIWYLLQSKRDVAAAAIEGRKLDIEEKKADAFALGLRSLGEKVDAHHTLDLHSHQELGEGIARVEGQLEAARWYATEKTNPGVEPPLPPQRRTPAFGVRTPRRGTHHDGED